MEEGISPLQRCSSVYSTAPADWAKPSCVGCNSIAHEEDSNKEEESEVVEVISNTETII